MSRPLQIELFAVLDRIAHRKELADAFKVKESTLSRWALGQWSMSIDDFVAGVRFAQRRGKHDLAAEAMTMLGNQVDFDVEPRTRTLPAESVCRLRARASREVSDLLEQAAEHEADGVVSMGELAAQVSEWRQLHSVSQQGLDLSEAQYRHAAVTQ